MFTKSKLLITYICVKLMYDIFRLSYTLKKFKNECITLVEVGIRSYATIIIEEI